MIMQCLYTLRSHTSRQFSKNPLRHDFQKIFWRDCRNYRSIKVLRIPCYYIFCPNLFSTSILQTVLKIFKICHPYRLYHIFMTCPLYFQKLTDITQPFSTFFFWYFPQNIPEIRNRMKCYITFQLLFSTLCNYLGGSFIKWLSGDQKINYHICINQDNHISQPSLPPTLFQVQNHLEDTALFRSLQYPVF